MSARSPLESWHRPNGFYRAFSAGLPSRMSGSAIDRIAEGLSRREARGREEEDVSVDSRPGIDLYAEADGSVMKLASLHDVPAGFVSMGTGFYRSGHTIWELRPAEDDDGYVLARLHEERAVDMRDKRAAAEGFDIEVNKAAYLRRDGQLIPVIVLDIGDSSADVEDEQGTVMPAPLEDLLSVDALMPDAMPMGSPELPCPGCGCASACCCPCHQGREPSQGFEPEIEPSSKAEGEREADPLVISLVRESDQNRSVTALHPRVTAERWVSPTKAFVPSSGIGKQVDPKHKMVYEVTGLAPVPNKNNLIRLRSRTGDTVDVTPQELRQNFRQNNYLEEPELPEIIQQKRERQRTRLMPAPSLPNGPNGTKAIDRERGTNVQRPSRVPLPR